MSQFGTMKLVLYKNSFKNYFGQFVWIEKKSHYNSRVSLHKAPTNKNTTNIVAFCHFILSIHIEVVKRVIYKKFKN